MVRAPADWRSVLRRAEVLVRRHDMRSLELLFPALRWRDPMARNRAVALLVRMGPLAVPPLLARLEGAETAAERWAAADALGRIGDSRAVARLLRALADPAMTVTPGEGLKRAAGLGRGAGSWSSGYDIALTWRRSPVRIRSSPLPFRVESRK